MRTCRDGGRRLHRARLMRFVLAVCTSTAAAVTFGVGPAAASAACTPTGFVRDGINLTAALINPGTVSGTVDATGCNIGVYYGPGSTGRVSKAEIYGANYFGVVNDGGVVDVMNSWVHDIGEVPFNGTQHGVGIYFAYDSGATGHITGNTVSRYQKGGIVVNGGNDSATINNNVVTGLGQVNFIAGNGIQLAFGATGAIFNNTVSDNAYTGTNDASSAGILVFGGCGDPQDTGVDIHNNTLSQNDMGIYLANYDAGCSSPSLTPTNDVVHNNALSNDAISNISGNGYPQGYQAGIVDIGNGDSIHNNTISGIGYAPPQTTSSIVIVPIDTSFTTNVKLHNNVIR